MHKAFWSARLLQSIGLTENYYCIFTFQGKSKFVRGALQIVDTADGRVAVAFPAY
jgi:hypothetical protein